MTDAHETGAVMVPLAQVAPHPASFRRRLVDLDELAASIARDGLYEPLVVMPADRVAAAWPEHAEELAACAWVLLWGHRRLAAARQVYADEPQAQVPVVIRRDRVCDDAQTQLDMMITNVLARRAWTPIEEARALRAATGAGRTQVEIAQLYGCHQSQVSGRLALLQLPEEAKEAVETGQLGVADARKLARLNDQDQMRAVWALYLNRREAAWIKTIDQATAAYAERADYEARCQNALALAEAEGVRVVDPFEEFGRNLPAHRLAGQEQVQAARDASTLVAGISGDGELEYYTTTISADATSDRGPGRGPDHDERQAAAAARERAGRTLAAQPPVLPTTAAPIVDALLGSAPYQWRPIAQRWLRRLRVGPPGDVEPDRWWQGVTAAGWDARVWAAHCLALAGSEYRARAHHEWDEADVAWVWHLVVECGYLPRPWERHRLTAETRPRDSDADRPVAGRAPARLPHHTDRHLPGQPPRRAPQTRL